MIMLQQDFEEWANAHGFTTTKHESGFYYSKMTEENWRGWQACFRKYDGFSDY